MPRYHVDTDYDGCTVSDIYGITLADDAVAQTHALATLANLACRHRSGEGEGALRVLLRDGNGRVFYGATVWLRGDRLNAVARGG